jgi:C4-dicarboxylate transporter
LAKRLDNKKSILQFFTKCLYDISTIKTLQFNNTKLKLIYNWYNTQSNSKILFQKEITGLNATILKDKYGYLYYYIMYLVDKDIIKLVSNHQRGISSRYILLIMKYLKWYKTI